MRSDQQSGDIGSGDSGFGGQFLGGQGSTGRRPWYGQRRLGYGYGPQTWQGWLVSALPVLALFVAGAVASGTPWFYAVVIAAVAVHLVIIGIRWRR